MDLSRKPNETYLDYHKRIIYGKLVDKTLGDLDYSELSDYAYGQHYSSDVARRMFYGSRRTLDLVAASQREMNANKGTMDELDEKIATISAMIEPLMMIMLAIVAGLLVGGVLFPIYSLVNSIG